MGRVVVLNGPSSAGKTTIARLVREARHNVLALSIDDLFHVAGSRTRNDWRLFSALSHATFAAPAALAERGFDVVVDTVLERAECIAMLRDAIADARLVAVTCPVEVLEARERARCDRRAGQARDQYPRVFHDAEYALSLDTSLASVDDSVARVCELFEP